MNSVSKLYQRHCSSVFSFLDVQTTSLALPPPCIHPPPHPKVCTLGKSMRCEGSALPGRQGRNQNGTANKRACIQAEASIVLCRACRRTWDERVPPPLQEPNRKSKFSRRMGQAQSYPPLGLAERRVQKEFWQDQRRLMQWIVFLLLASMAHTKLSVCLSVWKDTFTVQRISSN